MIKINLFIYDDKEFSVLSGFPGLRTLYMYRIFFGILNFSYLILLLDRNKIKGEAKYDPKTEEQSSLGGKSLNLMDTLYAQKVVTHF